MIPELRDLEYEVQLQRLQLPSLVYQNLVDRDSDIQEHAQILRCEPLNDIFREVQED